MKTSPEPAQSMGLGKKVEAPIAPKETRRHHVHGHIYEVDGKLVNEQPTKGPRKKTPAEQFYELFVKKSTGLF